MKKIKKIAKNHPVLTFWILAMLIATLIIPVGLYVFETFPDISKDIKAINNGKNYNTNILYSLPLTLKAVIRDSPLECSSCFAG